MKETFLKKRHEFKYELTPLQALEIEAYLDRLNLSEDENASNKGYYSISNLYFDSPQWDDYYAKEAGLLKRKKLRARTYGDEFDFNTDRVWLELKKKHDMAITKERIMLKGEEWQRFVEGDTFYFLRAMRESGSSEHRAIREFMYFYILQSYHPSMLVSYKRKPYMQQFTSAVRITLDKDIVAARIDGFSQRSTMIPVVTNGAILEVKFTDKMPWWFKRMAETYRLERTTSSKYVRSVDAVRAQYGIPLMK